MIPPACRCGWIGEGEHPCHADDYACRRPAKRRFYGAHPVALAGAQLKVQVADTWACDKHWRVWCEMMTIRCGKETTP